MPVRQNAIVAPAGRTCAGRTRLGALRQAAVALPIAAAIGVLPDRGQAAGIADAFGYSSGSAPRPPAARPVARSHPAKGESGAKLSRNDRGPAPGRRADAGSADLWGSLLAACTGGLVRAAATTEVLGVVSAVSAGTATPAAAGAAATAAAVGCGVGMASAAASRGSMEFWRKSMR